MNRMILTILFVFMLSVLSTYAGNVEESIKVAMEYAYNFELEEAVKRLDKIIIANPEDPRGYHFKSSVYLWKYFGNGERIEYDNFFKFSDLALDKAEKILDEKEDIDALYIIGANQGFRAIMYMRNDETMKAIWASKESQSALKRVVEIDKERYDVYFGLGLFNFALSYVPGVFKWALEIAGLSGGKNDGIKYLRLSSLRGKFTKVEASFFLSQIYLGAMAKYDSAAALLLPLAKKYDNNSLFLYTYAVALMKQRKINDAELYLNKILKINDSNFKQIIDLTYFLKGEVAFKENNFKSATENYLNFIESARLSDYKGIAYYRAAICFLALDNEEDFKKCMALADKGNNDLSDDAYAKRKSDYYKKRKFTDEELKIVVASNNIEAGKYLEACEQLNELIKNVDSESLKAEIYLYLADATFELNRFDESFEFANKAISLKNGEEKWIKPFAYFYRARCYKERGDNKSFQSDLYKAESFSNYDYYDKLNSLIAAYK